MLFSSTVRVRLGFVSSYLVLIRCHSHPPARHKYLSGRTVERTPSESSIGLITTNGQFFRGLCQRGLQTFLHQNLIAKKLVFIIKKNFF